eukprot:TRINITY_DN3059_c0_g1_i1.p1 TRINITY_DN3059_c0_g1~~TRINITY_DN3059_c0_g1_i1.p1  ORF type:complete len:131 (-),score=11.29 TRINITY_DN3059_c0_g1_i1:357-749(-)
MLMFDLVCSFPTPASIGDACFFIRCFSSLYFSFSSFNFSFSCLYASVLAFKSSLSCFSLTSSFSILSCRQSMWSLNCCSMRMWSLVSSSSFCMVGSYFLCRSSSLCELVLADTEFSSFFRLTKISKEERM